MTGTEWHPCSTIMPTVTHQSSDARVARLAQSHQVVPVIGTSMSQGNDVVDLGCCSHPALLQTLLAEWMGMDIGVADPLPRALVP